MKCPACNKVVPITKVLHPSGDAVPCIYCQHVIPSEQIAWGDGKFHFRILGDVTNISKKAKPLSPRILMQDQVASLLNLPKILEIAIKTIRKEPNLRCVAEEFMISDSHIRVDLLLEETS